MASSSSPRLLKPDDRLYRVIEPPFWDESGIKADAFEDPHLTDPETLSFFVAGLATPRNALSVLAIRSKARRDCGTGKVRPTPEQMFQAGYRVAALSAAVILDAIAAPDSLISIEEVDGGHVSKKGHLGIYDGRGLSLTFSKSARLLSEQETLE